jgi:hypothetical protein
LERSALISHSKGAKHRKNVSALKLSTQPSVMSYLYKSLALPAAANPDVSSTTSVSEQSLEAVTVPVPHMTPLDATAGSAEITRHETSDIPVTETRTQTELITFSKTQTETITEKILKTETI